MRNSEIAEAFIEVNKLHPTMFEIYTRSSSAYSNFKTLNLKKEYSLNFENHDEFTLYGILNEINMIYYVEKNNLHLYNYCTCVTEHIQGFSTPIKIVKCFAPLSGIFNQANVKFCLFIATQYDAVIYGIDSDNNGIFNTDFKCKMLSIPLSCNIQKGRIFIGSEDGNTYEIIYSTIPILNYKTMSVYSPTTFIMRAINALFKRKADRIISISSSTEYVISLSQRIDIFSITGSLSHIKTITPAVQYLNVQIIEEQPLLFYCIQRNGNRDYYTLEGKVFTKDVEFNITGKDNNVHLMIQTTKNKAVYLRKNNGIVFLSLFSFNEDQLVNFKTNAPCENYEQINADLQVNTIKITSESLLILSNSRLKEYEIFTHKQLLLNCRTEELYSIYKNYGELYFTIKYYELLAENEIVYRVESFCKNQNIKRFALYCFVAKLLKKIYKIDLCNMFSTGNADYIYFSNVVKKLKNILSKLNEQNKEAILFIDEITQTFHYLNYLNQYHISYNETLESILFHENSKFKEVTLQKILDFFSKHRSIDSLIRTMNNVCPIYLPIEKINTQLGIELIKGNTTQGLKESLKYFVNMSKINTYYVVGLFNSSQYYIGSIHVIKNSQTDDFTYENLVNLFKESVKCKGAISEGLNESRENIIYPFYEGLLFNFVQNKRFIQCRCCINLVDNGFNIFEIDAPSFENFLKEKHYAEDKLCDLLWKYQLHKNKKEDAVETLIQLAYRNEIAMEKKISFLEMALSINSIKNREVKRILEIYYLQKELSIRKQCHFNRLLSADSLLNDYMYDEYDLGILLLDILQYKNKKTLSDMWKNFILKTKNIEVIFEVISKLKNKTSCLYLFIDPLVNKIVNNNIKINMCHKLSSVGIDYTEIIFNIKNVLTNNNHPEIKKYLLNELKNYAKNNEYEEIQTHITQIYGI